MVRRGSGNPLIDDDYIIEDPEHVSFDLAEAIRWCFRHGVSFSFFYEEATQATILELSMDIKGQDYFYKAPVTHMIEAPWVLREMAEKAREKFNYE